MILITFCGNSYKMHKIYKNMFYLPKTGIREIVEMSQGHGVRPEICYNVQVY